MSGQVTESESIDCTDAEWGFASELMKLESPQADNCNFDACVRCWARLLLAHDVNEPYNNCHSYPCDFCVCSGEVGPA